ncbi:glycosyltransferase family 4 protein [Winogradskyella bathintestinalis]|uniref:Glycosyltransferase family 4 protein n=1 Tax=Winogradskyella bathintestinalis TaxID=3035208 RepID=A0ABT7ZTQ6_9FLAO|nr:glycosyltransferase family 4 protein [Winogradskyella bathintestinalis]MDN3492406.1 glycosyltransferase family 4 protein [Winogradskyella bathintestinalis]
MKNVLYIGNNLKTKTSNISGIQTLGALLEQEGYTMYYASSKANKLLRLLDMIWSILKFHKNVDFVLIDTYSTVNFYYALVISQLCRLLKIKYVPILHGGNLEHRLKDSSRFSGLIFNNAYTLVAPSGFLKTVFETYGYKNIIYIPNTFEITNYTFQHRDLNTPRLLWVRSFSEIYNPKLAIHVFNALKKNQPHATLCMVGPDSDGSLVEVKQLASQLHLKVEFTGKLTKRDWIALSKDYNVFINTTNFDNTPLSVIEAMALGLPIVSTNVGGLPYLITDAVDGMLVAPDLTAAMVEAINTLQLDEDLRIRLVTNARKKVENFDWNAIKLKWNALFLSE